MNPVLFLATPGALSPQKSVKLLQFQATAGEKSIGSHLSPTTSKGGEQGSQVYFLVLLPSVTLRPHVRLLQPLSAGERLLIVKQQLS